MKSKDPNYAVKVEKAITEKYGEETVQHPKKGWNDEKEKEYLQQSIEEQQKFAKNAESQDKIEADGFLINKKLLNRDYNRTCPVCSTYSFNKQDDLYMNKFECCFKCYIDYVEDREDRWKAGWRPNKENKNG